MTKSTTNGVTNFHATCPLNTAPKIVDKFMDDEGNENYVLESGRTTLADKYNSMWHPKRGVVITDKKYKGENPDSTKNIYK